jgi:hypothetical protein
MLFDNYLTTHNVGTYAPGNGYTYATYSNYLNAIKDYVVYIHHYIDIYNLSTIYGATARWIGKTPGSSGHLSYVNIIVNDMIEYEYPQGGYETGDDMIFSGASIVKSTGRLKQRYPITNGMELYRSTDGSFLKKFSGVGGNAWFLGPINGYWPANGIAEWGAVLIGVGGGLGDPAGTTVFIKKPYKSRVINV